MTSERFLMAFLCLLLSLSAFGQENQKIRQAVIHFQEGKTRLDAHAESILLTTIDQLNKNEIIEIRIKGHSFREKPLEPGRNVSYDRAMYTHVFLQDVLGESFPYLVSAHDDEDPAYWATDAAPRNRRVEIDFLLPPPPLHKSNNHLVCGMHYAQREKEYLNSLNFPEKHSSSQDTKETIAPSKRELFYDDLDVKEQRFMGNIGKPTVIQGAKGTKIIFQGDEFCDCETKEPITYGQVEFKLREYYELGDFLRGGLSTMTNTVPLQTVGSVHFEATSQGKKLCIAKGKEFDILFPHGNDFPPSPEVGLFYGNRNKNGKVTWGSAGKNTVKNKDFIYQYKKFTNKDCHFLVGWNTKKDPFNDRVRTFFKNHEKWKDYKFRRSKKGFDKYVQTIRENRVKKELCRRDREKYGRAFQDYYSEKIWIELDESPIELATQNYVLRSKRMGLLNCDSFYRLQGKENRSLVIPVKHTEYIDIKILIPKKKILLEATKDNTDGYILRDISTKLKLKVFLVDFSGDLPKFAYLETNTATGISPDEIIWEEMNKNALKKRLSKLEKWF